jgi:amidase/aspartyl-tRNA(Asn)/glutamyl-tRNA(Gln) amidotransferase subunit A
MRDTIKGISQREIYELANEFGFAIGPDTESLVELVNDRLSDGLDDIYEIPIDGTRENLGERTWGDPKTDPYNAVITKCSVPPVEHTTDLLTDITIGLKDNIAVANIPMQAASGVLSGFIPASDAAVTERLRRAGARITAKTTLDEFAAGGRGKTSKGLVKNPRDQNRIAGGTSGGSGAAVAAGIVDAALGTDTGGSLRKPAAFCGIVAIKPTYGLVPLTGIIENTYTIDHVGPAAPTIELTARVLEAIAGKDNRDPASMAAAGSSEWSVGGYVDAVKESPNVEDLHIAVAKQGLTDPIQDKVAKRHSAALDALEYAGATLEERKIPFLDQTKHIKNVLSYVELAAYWRDGSAPVRRGGLVDPNDQAGLADRLHTENEPVNEFFRSRQIAGAHLLKRYGGRHYTQAHAAREVVRDEVIALLEDYDALVTPTVPFFAPELEHVRSPDFDYDGLEDNSVGYGRYTKIGNITGLPSITVPNDIKEGPGVGFQLIGQPFDDAAILGMSKPVERILSNPE